ncbi:MAG: pantoate--beta-alanine ligase [Prevotellaceae bacterium]|jgi:pantoate--beta-alanine ligase|nr:pantoate--beta-alanine ligase [Prevotellaceae bacterium]
METVHTIDELRQLIADFRTEGRMVGFVPTMGALHEGHASLVRRSVSENAATVVSIFVNPTQFNDAADLEKYPRTLEADSRLLEACGADILFAPTVTEMYPVPDDRTFSYPPLDTVMEGHFRPGHFNGVCQIVSKLFDAVRPDRAYFGEKDFQQLAIVRRMTRALHFPIEIVGCPIVREADGLAMSSRNARLSTKERKQALAISRALQASQAIYGMHLGTVEQMEQLIESYITRESDLRLEYFSIVDADTLQPIDSWDDARSIVGCIAAYCGEVRLIDNIKYK